MRMPVADQIIQVELRARKKLFAVENARARELQIAGDIEGADDRIQNKGIFDAPGSNHRAGQDSVVIDGIGMEANVVAIKPKILPFEARLLIGVEPPANR